MDYAPQDGGRVIYHEGVAEEVRGNSAVVRFVQSGACGSCTLKSICNPAEQRVRHVTVTHDGSLRTGEACRIGVAESVAWLSILFSFVLPFIVVATTFFTLYFRTADDIVAGVSSLAVLPLYYLLVYACRNRLRGKVRFMALPVAHRENKSMRGIS